MPLKLWNIHTFRQEFTEIQGFKQQTYTYITSSYIFHFMSWSFELVHKLVVARSTCSICSTRSPASQSFFQLLNRQLPSGEVARLRLVPFGLQQQWRDVARLISWQRVGNQQLSPICWALSSVKQIFGKMKNAKFIQYIQSQYTYIYT